MTDQEINARLDELEAQITRDEDMLEIRKCIDTYLLYFQGADCNGITSTVNWDAPEPKVWSEAWMGGRVLGPRSNLQFFDQRPTLARYQGAIVQHESASPVIEVAKDGKTAKVCSFSPGFKCLAYGHAQTWSQSRYYQDLIKIDGVWKIWHWHAMLAVEGHAAYGWLYQNMSYWKECLFSELDGIHNKNIDGGLGPDSGAETYRPDAVFYLYPEPSQPYDTYEHEDDMLNTRGY